MTCVRDAFDTGCQPRSHIRAPSLPHVPPQLSFTPYLDIVKSVSAHSDALQVTPASPLDEEDAARVMTSGQLAEVDALEILVVIDNELDTFAKYPNAGVDVSGGLPDMALRSGRHVRDRGEVSKEIKMSSVCCGAFGLSLMVVRGFGSAEQPPHSDVQFQTASRDGLRHTVLFDTGPEEEAWERNAQRLKADVGAIELVTLSHWHRDHSGGKVLHRHQKHAN